MRGDVDLGAMRGDVAGHDILDGVILVVVLTSLALAAVVFVIHVEDRAGTSTSTARVGSRFDDMDAGELVQVELPRAVLGYDPVVVREALAAAVRLPEREAARHAEAAPGDVPDVAANSESEPGVGDAAPGEAQRMRQAPDAGDQPRPDETHDHDTRSVAPGGEDDEHA